MTGCKDGGPEAGPSASPAARWSVVVVARNAAHLLADCLRSVPDGVPIWLIDHRSKDETVARALLAGARVVSGTGPLGALRQQGLDAVQTPWALFLDADERLVPGAGPVIERALADASGAQAGYRLGFHTWLGGERLRTGGWGNTRHLRLVRVAVARCDRAARVHERLSVRGEVSNLPRLVDHLSFEDARHAAKKLRRYAVLGARSRVEARRHRGSSGLSPSGLLDASVRTAWRWFRRVVLLGAWLQPRSALRLAGLDAGGVWLKHRRAARLWQRSGGSG